MEEKILKTIKSHQLLLQGEIVLVALSGGPDSVALLRALLNLGFPCEAAHCNFHLRGEESMRDDAFVMTLCTMLGVPLNKIDFDTKTYAAEHKISIEMAARDLRYAYFANLCKKKGIHKIAVAHHLNDNAETLLLNLLRGTGVRGLAGIRYLNGNVVRPMLDIRRIEILQYLNALQQDYVVDSSNLQDDVTRNKIRLRLIPLLNEISPSAETSIALTAQHMAEAADYLAVSLAEEAKKVTLSTKNMLLDVDVEKLQRVHSPHLLLFYLLQPFGFNSSQIQDVFQHMCDLSEAIYIVPDTVLLRSRSHLLLYKEQKYAEDLFFTMDACGTYKLPDGTLDISKLFMEDLKTIPTDSNVACLDADLVKFPLIVRRVKAGDRFVPFGMRGSRLLSDYMTDRKFSHFDKEQQCVVCSEGKIIWLVNERPANDVAIVRGKTKNVLRLIYNRHNITI